MSAKRILLVEDDIEQAMLFEQVLQISGYNIEVAKTAEEALEQLGKQQYDVLLTDWLLPAMGGDALITTTRRAYPAMKTILLSTGSRIEEAAKACQADGVFRKTENYQILRQLIADILTRITPTTAGISEN